MLKPSKAIIAREVEALGTRVAHPLSILELGCGTAAVLAPFVKAHPGVTYVGIEPSAEALALAREHLGERHNITLIQGFAYDGFKEYENRFDVVVSMSVLEHVKDLPAFIRLSNASAKPGGTIIHLYDLGHSLHSSSSKERLQVFLCNNPVTRFFIPEQKIARYVAHDDVVKLLEKSGATVVGTTYHNAPATVANLKKARTISDKELLGIAEREMKEAEAVADERDRERAFPSVCIWARKNNS